MNEIATELRCKLDYANKQLEKFNKVLAEKDRIIDCLGSDLENILDQLDSMAITNQNLSGQWVGRPVPGLNAN